MNIELASPSDLVEIRALLQACDLPSADVSVRSLEHFLTMRSESLLIGLIGLERYDDTGLLRSLAVSPEHRGRGHGLALTRAIERHAADSGVHSLYLLTTTAAPFFATNGFRVIDRASAPPSIQNTTQFSTLCPSSSTLMTKP